MSLIQGIEMLTDLHRDSVVSIGNFDGVHKGHRHVVQTLLNEAQRRSLKSTVITFDPLPKEYFSPGSIARLSTLDEKAEILFGLGVDQVLCIKFNHALSQYSPERFIQDVLLQGLGTQFLSVGDDFHFGHQRAGDFNTLCQAGQQYGFTVQRHETVSYLGERVSSERIRAALENDELDLAKDLLGRPYSISGEIQQGQKLGRTLAFPTANIALAERCVPVAGVYAIRVAILPQITATHQAASSESETYYSGVANVGVRPTVDGKEQRLEAHLFDFDQDIYGQRIRVEFVRKIRAEKKFESLDALKAQIQVDADQARQIMKQRA